MALEVWQNSWCQHLIQSPTIAAPSWHMLVLLVICKLRPILQLVCPTPQGLPAVTNFAVSTTPETWQPILQVNPEVMQTCASSTFSSYQLFAAGMCMAQTCMVPSPNEAPQLPNSVDLR